MAAWSHVDKQTKSLKRSDVDARLRSGAYRHESKQTSQLAPAARRTISMLEELLWLMVEGQMNM